MPLDKIIVFISEKIVWDTPLVMLCLFSGLYFSFKTKFPSGEAFRPDDKIDF